MLSDDSQTNEPELARIHSISQSQRREERILSGFGVRSVSVGIDRQRRLKKQAEAEFKTIFGNIIQGNDQIYVPSQVELSQGILNALKESAKTPDLGNIMGSVLLGSAIIADIIALDPPDPNYKKVEPPQPLSWPTTGNKTINQVIADSTGWWPLDHM